MVVVGSFVPAQNKFRFYDDGSEGGSTPKAAEDTNINLLTDTDQSLGLRILIQETGNGASSANADFKLQYSYNGGAYTDVTNASSVVLSYPSASLTDGANTTNRATNGITDGTGSFVAGEVEEANGAIENCQLTALNFTEHLWSLTVVAADTAHNNDILFRVLFDNDDGGGYQTMVYNIYPKITVKKTVANNVIIID